MEMNRNHWSGTISRAFSVAGCLVLSVLVAAGCSSKRSKAKRVIEKKKKACSNAEMEGAFAQVSLYGEKKVTVLDRACDKDIEQLQKKDNFTFTAQTGPYKWEIGLDTEMGVWRAMDVDWPLLSKIQRRLNVDRPTVDTLKEVESLYAKAQQAFPESRWVRFERFKNLLRLRARTRSVDEKHPSDIGDRAQEYLQSLMAWSEKIENPYVANRARYMVVRHLLDFKDKLDRMKNPSGKTDQWLEKAVEVAMENDNPEKAEKYKKELKDQIKDKQKAIELAEKLMKPTKNKICDHLKKLMSAEVKNKQLKQKVAQAAGRINC